MLLAICPTESNTLTAELSCSNKCFAKPFATGCSHHSLPASMVLAKLNVAFLSHHQACRRHTLASHNNSTYKFGMNSVADLRYFTKMMELYTFSAVGSSLEVERKENRLSVLFYAYAFN